MKPLDKIKISKSKLKNAEIIGENDNYFYGVLRKIRFYHTTPNCFFLEYYKKLCKINEINMIDSSLFEIEAFETKESAINNGYYYPCPLCAFSVYKIYKVKLNDGSIAQIPLDGLDIIFLIRIHNLWKSGRKTIFVKDVRIDNITSYSEAKEILINIERYGLIKFIDNMIRREFILTQFGEKFVEYISEEYKYIPSDSLIESLATIFNNKYKKFRTRSSYEEEKSG